MRIRLTLDIERRRADPQVEPPYVVDNGWASHDRSERHPIGFTADPGSNPEPDWEERR